MFGVEHPEQTIQFEKPVKLGHRSFIDGYIPATRVIIEQKSFGKSLDVAYKQSDGAVLTPFQQAKRYNDELGFSERARWIVTSDFASFRIYDMERPHDDPEIVLLKDLVQNVHRLQFLVDSDREGVLHETAVSLEAGQIIGKIHDALRARYREPDSEESQHSLNVLCVRLVFCLYADSAGVFGREGMFGDYLHAHKDNLRDALLKLFRVLDQKEDERDEDDWDDLLEFPYVNGGLFRSEAKIPKLTPEIADLILFRASDSFNWRDISSSIFGAIFEDTLNPDTRRQQGMHYTTVENIRHVINPLFLDELRAELEHAMSYKTVITRRRRLEAFRDKLATLRFLDPACGSGNFLTQTYVELRRLENRAVEEIAHGQIAWEETNPVRVSIGQFYGIESNDFAVSVAQTALWIAEAQMLQETEIILNTRIDYLPLSTTAHIAQGNALRMDWNDVLPAYEASFVMGNPPFVGHQWRTETQARDMEIVCHEVPRFGKLDYVCAWFVKAVKYSEGTAIQTAFVATNSAGRICWDSVEMVGVERCLHPVR